MASVEERLFSRLSGHVGLSALVGTRVYPVVAPQSPTYPLVLVQRVSGVREHAMGADPGTSHSRFQVKSVGATYSSAHATSVQVRAALQRWMPTTGTPEVHDVMIDNEIHLYEAEGNGAHHIVQDFMVHHEE